MLLVWQSTAQLQNSNVSKVKNTVTVMDVKGEASSQSETAIKSKPILRVLTFFGFEWTDRDIVTSEERLSVVWNDGKQTYGYYS